MKKAASIVLLLMTASLSFGALTLYTTPAGDASYGYNTKYGPYGYTAGGTEIGVSLYMGAPYGNDITIGLFEVPIAALVGKDLTSATLEVYATGFGTNYYYGSASIGWVDTGTKTLTGNVVDDALGAVGGSVSYYIYYSDNGDTPAGWKSFDFLSCIQADLAAGRSYSTFVLAGSRDTYGSICTAESGMGPRIVTNVPEPATLSILGLSTLLLRKRK